MRKNNDLYTNEGQGQKAGDEPDSQANPQTAGAAEDSPAAADGAAEQELLQRRIADLTQEKEELMGRLLRLQADFDNFRKRSRTEREEIIAYAASDLVCKLLPVIDNLDRACASAEAAAGGIAEGVAMITRQLKELLEREGLQPIECKGKPFDPNYHDAVMSEESSDHPPDTVVDELQKGYMLKDKLLRPSMVKVSVNKS